MTRLTGSWMERSCDRPRLTRLARQYLTRRLRICRDLVLQFVKAGEFALGANEFDQRHSQMPSVEVAVDIEKMRFEPRHEAANRGPEADIGDAVDALAAERVVGPVARYPHRIDAEGRTQIFAEADIGGRKTDRAAALVAERDAAVDLPEPAELRRRLARLPGLQEFANMGRGIDRRIAATHRLDHGDAESPHRAAFAQHVGRAAPPVTEGAVMPDDNV